MKKRIAILGSTGSIGGNTLDVLARHPEAFEVFALTAAKQVDAMAAQCAQFRPRFAVMVDDAAAKRLADKLAAESLPTQVLTGPENLVEIAAHPECDMIMAAIVGAAGLPACMAAAKAGKRLLLANKEALVVGADLFMQAVEQGGATLLPIDSEHSAIFQSLPSDRALWPGSVEKIILTASGGPFLQRDLHSFADITPKEACAHPNWVMGRKISVDSATMMNKALEVIEAKYLFGLKPEQIEVMIHPQSIIHSMVQYHDTSVVAQLGNADMRVPIAYGLSWPARLQSGAKALDFSQLKALTFLLPEADRFPGLALAWQVLNAPFGSTAVLNAANEVAVEAFLSKQLRFDQIHRVNAETLRKTHFTQPQDLPDLLALDAESRRMAASVIQSLV